jgi:acylphosphatase
MQHLNIHIYGIVQGVGFRYAIKQQARLMGINGFVRNEPDGSVYMEAEGDDSALAEFVLWCRKGPAYARVEDVKIENESLKYYTSFDARH